MVLPQSHRLFQAVLTAVQQYYLTRHLTTTPVQTHELASNGTEKRLKDDKDVGTNVSKKSIPPRRPQLLPINLAFALVAKPISFNFQPYTHFAERVIRPLFAKSHRKYPRSPGHHNFLHGLKLKIGILIGKRCRV